jgi:fructose-bisphosphate aldolase class I
MEGEAEGKPVCDYLWKDRRVAPFLKVDKGLQTEADGVSLMKPTPQLDGLLKRAVDHGVFGTKMRSTIRRASASGIAAIVDQQFEVGDQIAGHGLMPIIEPEVSIKAPDRAEAEGLLLDQILKHLDQLPTGRRVMLEVTMLRLSSIPKPCAWSRFLADFRARRRASGSPRIVA